MSATIPADEWHAIRARHVGGSEVAALFGVQPDYAMSHYALWHVKAGLAPPPVVDNPRVKWGLRLERAIADAAAEENGWTIEPGGYRTDETTPGLGCTLDFVIAADPAEEGPGVLEIKNADWLVHRRSWSDGEPPLHILLQLQHQLAATGYGWGVVGCLVGGNDLRLYRYKARPKLIGEIRAKVAAFWASIDAGKPPPVDGSDSATAVLRALYPEPVDEIADLTADNELPGLCADLLNASERRRAAEKDEQAAKNAIAAKLGNHLAAECEGFRIRVAVTPEKPDRVAEPGEIIKGRAASRRLSIKELIAA